MKKLSLLLVSVALFSFVSLNSCKQAPKADETVEEAVEEVIEETEAIVDSAAAAIEETIEEVAE
ncbi:MAG: hypothetical protein R6W78_05615 [Bacteroidales bacterium]